MSSEEQFRIQVTSSKLPYRGQKSCSTVNKIHLLNNHITDINAPTSTQNMVSRNIDHIFLVISPDHRICADRTATEYKVWPEIPNFLDTGAESM